MQPACTGAGLAGSNTIAYEACSPLALVQAQLGSRTLERPTVCTAVHKPDLRGLGTKLRVLQAELEPVPWQLGAKRQHSLTASKHVP